MIGGHIREHRVRHVSYSVLCSLHMDFNSLISSVDAVSLPVWVQCYQSVLSLLTQRSVALVKFHHSKWRKTNSCWLKTSSLHYVHDRKDSSENLLPHSLPLSSPYLFAPCLGWCMTGGAGERAFFFSAFLAISLCFSVNIQNTMTKYYSSFCVANARIIGPINTITRSSNLWNCRGGLIWEFVGTNNS